MSVIGIDLGALHCRAVRLDVARKMPMVLRNDLSHEATPSVVSLPLDGARLFGENASAKELSRPAETAADLMPWLADPDAPQRSIGNAENLSAPQVAGYFLANMLRLVPKTVASPAPEPTADESAAPAAAPAAPLVCIAVPTGATPQALAAVRDSLIIAGVAVENIALADAAEAAAAYLHHSQLSSLPDDGETPLAVIIVNVGHSACSIIAVELTKATVTKRAARSVPLGSRAADEGLAQFCFDHIKATKKVDIRGHAKSYRRVLRECRKAKEMCSSVDRAQVQVEALAEDIDLNISITRQQCVDFAAPLVSALSQALREVREEIAPIVVGRVEAIGAGWRPPFIQDAIREALGVERVGVSLDSALAVAEGTAILAAMRAPALGGEQRDASHNAALVNFSTFDVAALPATDAATLQRWCDEEAAAAAADAAAHARVAAINALDAYLLQTLETASNMSGEAAARCGALVAALRGHEEYVRDDCNGDDTAAITARLAAVRASVAEEYPEVEAHLEAEREAQRQRDAELERLSKLQAEDKELKSDPQRLRVAQTRREQGQTLFKQECWAEAQTRFVQALAILRDVYAAKEPENAAKIAEISLSCHLNIASCSIKLKLWRNAINNCTDALELSPNNAKALYRRGQARHAIAEYAEARRDLERARDLSGGDPAVAAELAAVIASEERQKAKEKKAFSKMFA